MLIHTKCTSVVPLTFSYILPVPTYKPGFDYKRQVVYEKEYLQQYEKKSIISIP